jgi:hypothetical protein
MLVLVLERPECGSGLGAAILQEHVAQRRGYRGKIRSRSMIKSRRGQIASKLGDGLPSGRKGPQKSGAGARRLQ